MKKVFNALSIIGLIIIFLVSIITTNDPFKVVNLSTIGHLKFMYYFVYYSFFYLGGIWLLYCFINKINDILNLIKIKYKESR